MTGAPLQAGRLPPRESSRVLIELDGDAVRRLIETWRVAIDFELAQDDCLKIQLMARRGEVLSKLAFAAGAWLVLLRKCATPRSRDIEEIEADLNEFRSWARHELQALRAICEDESLGD